MGYKGKGYRGLVINEDTGNPNPNLLVEAASKGEYYSTIFGGTTEHYTTELYNGLDYITKISGGTDSGGNGGVQSLLSSHYPGWNVPVGDYTFSTWHKADVGVIYKIVDLDGVKNCIGTGEWETQINPKTLESPYELHQVINVEDDEFVLIGGIKLERGLIGTKFVAGV
jgi:hypothetical protein